MSDNGTMPDVQFPTAAKLRAFAVERGLAVGQRGFISGTVKAAFLKAPKRLQKKFS